MNLKPLFAQQKLLMERIEKEHPPQPGENRFDKKVLALLVEVGECANEWRGFKYWSKNQKPNNFPFGSLPGGFAITPLLEEYVDGLHFVLELGIEIDCVVEEYDWESRIILVSVTEQFNYLFNRISHFAVHNTFGNYLYVLDVYIGLGEMLGFTREQIEQAYMEKNKINFKRQDENY